MVEGWERNRQALEHFKNVRRLGILAPVLVALTILADSRWGLMEPWYRTLMWVCLVLSIVSAIFLTPVMGRKAVENSRRFVKRYPFDDAECRERLETGLAATRVPFEKDRWLYHVTYGGTKVEVWPVGLGPQTSVYVMPPEEGWSMDGFLRLMDQVLS